MANFLDNLSSYNAKAALAISNAVAAGDTQKANMMSSLKSTANDETLSEAVRLNALTALVNLGNLLEIPLPPYFPMSVQYADIQTYEGVHNDLLGIQGGAPNEYYHLTFAERAAIASAASLSDITWANLLGSYTDNNTFAALFDAKQAALSAPVGDHFVKINGTTISYDNSVYLTSSTGLASGSAAGGDLTGNYPNPTVLNSAVISKLLVGWNGSASNVPVTSSDSILTGMQKLNARINDIVANPGGVSSVALSTNAPAIFDGTAAQTGAATVTLGLRNQNANLFLASSSTLSNTQPTFRAIAVDDLPTASGVTPQQYGSTTLIPQITVDSKGRITDITNVTAAAGGQVNTVTLSVPSGSIYSSSFSGTATAPVLNFSVQSQAPNTVYAGPASGSSNVVPSFRALVAADIANIPIPQSQVTGLGDTLATFMTNSLAKSTMYVGNGSDAAVAGTVSGDLEMAYVDNNGADEAVFTIQNGVVTYDKIQNVTSGKVLGRYSTIDGPPQHLTFDPTAFTLNTTSGVIGLQTPNPSLLTNKGDILTRGASAPTRLGIGANATIFMADNAELTSNKWVAMSGDATIAVSGALTIANSAVTLGKMANLAANSIIGNNTGSSATPIALTATQATAMLDLFDTATTTKGLVQGSNGNTSYFLRGDNTWQPITGTGTVTSVAVDTDNGFAGTVADPTGDAIITLSTTVTGILQGNGTAISAATAGTDYVAPGDVTTSGLTMVTARLLGRTNSGTGAIESISVNSSLSLASTTLGLNLAHTNVFTAQQEMTAIKLNGSTSGYVSFTPPATAGTQNYTLPTAFPTGGGTKYLTSNGSGTLTWDVPAGSGTTTESVTFNTVAGDTAPKAFNGSQPMTIGYATVGAQQANANLTGLSALTYTSGSPLVRMTGAGTFTLDGATYVTGTATQYAVLVGGASNTVASITAGTTTGQLLQYNSGSNNPSWSSVVYPTSTTQDRILFSSSNNVIGQIAAPSNNTFLQYASGSYAWTAAVTSLTLSTGIGGIVSNSGTATAPVLSVSGTLGGLVYFDSATSWDSTGALDQGELIVGGGSGAPSTINNGAAGTILRSTGAGSSPSWTTAEYPSTTQANRILFSSSNNVVDQIAPPTMASTFLQWNGSSFTWATAGGGGGGSGTVTSVSVTPGNGFSGTVINPTTTPAIEISTTISGILKGSAGALTAATPGVDYAPATSGTSILKGNGSGGFANAVAGTDYLTSVGLTMPAAFNVANSPLTANGTLNVTASGTAAQYIRGDGQLALLPTSGGGGTTTNYYLNGSVASSVVGYEQMSKTPVIGAGTDFTITNTSGYIASFLTDAGDPSLLNIPAGAWEFNLFFQSSNTTGSPEFYVELYKYDGTTFTLIGTSPTEPINATTSIQYYSTSVAVPPSTNLSLTDRIAVRIHVNTAGNRTITLHTEDSHLCQVVTTFASGIISLNGLNAQAQFFSNGSSGLAPNWSSVSATHTLNIPLASTANVTAGLISNTDYTTFSNKISNPMTTLGDIIYGGTVVGGVATPTRLGVGSPGQVLGISAGIPAWVTAGAGDVTSTATGSPQGNFAIFDDNTGKAINTSSVATLGASPSGRATFNNGVDVGVSTSTTGTLVFRNATTSATTILTASTSQSTNLIYTLPITAPAAGNILSSDINGNLSWTAAGAGNVTTGGTQTFTGTNTFNANSLRVNNATNNGYHTLASLAAASATLTATFPAASGTVPLLSLAQTFTAAQTFQAGIALTTAGTFTTAAAVASTFNGSATFSLAASTGTAVTISGAGSVSTPQLAFTGATSWISYGQGDRAVPSTSGTRSIGTKINLYTGNTVGNADHAIGVAPAVTWISAPTATSHKTSIYGGASELAYFQNNGIYAQMPGSSTQGQVTIGTNTAGNFAYIDFGALTNVRATPTTTAASNFGKRITLFGDSHSIGVGSNETWITTNNVTGGTVSFYGVGATNFEKIAQIFASSSTNCVFDLTGAGANTQYRINGTKVVGPRRTGWTAQTATASRADLGANPTTAQLASFCKALYDDLASAVGHGLIN